MLERASWVNGSAAATLCRRPPAHAPTTHLPAVGGRAEARPQVRCPAMPQCNKQKPKQHQRQHCWRTHPAACPHSPAGLRAPRPSWPPCWRPKTSRPGWLRRRTGTSISTPRCKTMWRLRCCGCSRWGSLSGGWLLLLPGVTAGRRVAARVTQQAAHVPTCQRPPSRTAAVTCRPQRCPWVRRLLVEGWRVDMHALLHAFLALALSVLWDQASRRLTPSSMPVG